MSRSNNTTHAVFRMFSAMLIVAFAGCEELGINPKQESAQTESGTPPIAEPVPVAQGMAPAQQVPAQQVPVQQAPAQIPSASAMTPESIVAAFMAARNETITDNMIMQVAELVPANELITEIDLRGASVTGNGLAAMARLPQLRKVDMRGSLLPETELAGISEVTQLEELVLENATINDTSMAVIAPLVNLKALNIGKTAVTDEGFKHLIKMSKLETIICHGLMIEGAGFEAFTAKYAKAQLKNIDASYTQFGAFGFKHLTGMKQLESLLVSNSLVTDDVLKGIRGCAGMRVLDLSGNRVTDQGFKHLNGMKALEILVATGNPLVSDFTLNKLDSCKGLKKLHIQGTACSEKGILKLKQALPECVITFTDNRTY